MDALGTFQITQQASRQAAPPTLPATTDPSKAREAAESFEAFFIGQYIEHMFAGIRTDGMFGGGNGEDVFRSMLLQEYGKSIAASGGIGIADSVQREILRIQERAQQKEPAQ